MPGLLDHSPADITSRVLIALGLGVDPDDANEAADLEGWPVHVSVEPDVPDNVITVYNTQGVQHSSNQYDGEVNEHYGIQVKVRARTDTEGWTKAVTVAQTMDKSIYDELLTIGSSNYKLQSFGRTSAVLPIGQDPGVRDTVSFTINGMVSIRKLN